jgi:hypothetical protein
MRRYLLLLLLLSSITGCDMVDQEIPWPGAAGGNYCVPVGTGGELVETAWKSTPGIIYGALRNRFPFSLVDGVLSIANWFVGQTPDGWDFVWQVQVIKGHQMTIDMRPFKTSFLAVRALFVIYVNFMIICLFVKATYKLDTK